MVIIIPIIKFGRVELLAPRLKHLERIPEKVFHQILALGEAWRVRQVDYVEKESKVLIRVEETPVVWATQSCPHCQSKSVGGYNHAPERRWRHLNVCQLNSEIMCALPRGQCRQCQKVHTVRAP